MVIISIIITEKNGNAESKVIIQLILMMEKGWNIGRRGGCEDDCADGIAASNAGAFKNDNGQQMVIM